MMPPSPNKQPQALDCWENHSSLRARSAPTRALSTSPLRPCPLRSSSRRLWTAGRITALSAHGVRLLAPSPTKPSPTSPSSEQAAAGSGLLGESQLSLRTECACAPPQHALSDQARDREALYSPSPTTPPPTTPSPNKQPQALDCCQNYSSLRARSAPTRPLPTRAPQALDCWENHSSLRARSAPARPPNTPSPTMPGTAGLRLPDHRSEPKWHGHPACDPKPEWPLR
ncbi:MAG: hypothetical protein DVB22_001870 [Verrucomicrobia bacterium]|nr:MAG: hypothetical protein DVB22_001870 [Verrucomicrobiota bacterium]